MLHVSGPAKDFFLTLLPDAQEEILGALKLIEERPFIGEPLLFPWEPGILAHSSEHYFITYRVNDDIPQVANISKMPTAEDVEQAFWDYPRIRNITE